MAVVVATLSLLLPLLGTLAAVCAVWWASRTSADAGANRLVQVAAVLTVAVVLVHLLGALLVLPSSVELLPTRPVAR